MLDAYSIRKAIPRILIAVIAINLSIYLCVAALDITTVVSKSLSDLIAAPFVQDGGVTVFDGEKDVQIPANASNTLAGGGILAAIIGGLIFVVANPLGVIGLLLPLLIALVLIALAVLITLVLRQGLLLFLIVVSPVAIAAYVLPGTEKYFQKWLELFTKALLMYPIIMAIFAISNALGAILLRNGAGDTTASASFYANPANILNTPILAQADNADAVQTVTLILAIFVIYSPLFLIPFSIQMSGGLMAGFLGGAKGALKKANLGGKAGAGFNKSRQDPTSFLGKRELAAQDRRLRRGMTIGQVTSGIGAMRRGEGIAGYREASQGRADIKARMAARQATQNPMMQQLAFDDNANAVMALSGGSADGARAAAAMLARENNWTYEQEQRALATASAVGFSGTNTLAAIDTMAQNKSRALTGNLAGQGGLNAVRASAAAATGNNAQLTGNAVGSFSYHSRNAGRLDHGGEGDGNTMQDGWERATVQQHASAYGASTQAYLDQFSENINTGSTEERRAAAVAFAELHGALPNATADNQRRINQAMDELGIDHEEASREGGLSVQQQLANIANGHDPLQARVRDDAEAASITRTTRERDASGRWVSTGQAVQGPYQRTISSAEIHGLARTYGAEVPLRNQAEVAGAGVTPPPDPNQPQT